MKKEIFMSKVKLDVKYQYLMKIMLLCIISLFVLTACGGTLEKQIKNKIEKDIDGNITINTIYENEEEKEYLVYFEKDGVEDKAYINSEDEIGYESIYNDMQSEQKGLQASLSEPYSDEEKKELQSMAKKVYDYPYTSAAFAEFDILQGKGKWSSVYSNTGEK